VDTVLFIVFIGFLILFLLGLVYLLGRGVFDAVRLRKGVTLPLALEYDWSAGGLEPLLEEIEPLMTWAGYELAWTDETHACYVHSYRPVWRIAVAILLLPIGLLLLLWRKTDSLVFELLPLGERSRLLVSGKFGERAEGRLREVLSELGNERLQAGWYPNGTGIERFWDGNDWTSQTRPERVVVGPRMNKAGS
jgi:Protein of unknown function (DUF2510)